MSTPSIKPQSHLLPLDLKRYLPHPDTPWRISDPVFQEMRSQQGEYKKVEILPTHPEWPFVWRSFHHDPPQGYEIAHVHCIHDRNQQDAYESNIASIEKKTFSPSWDQEPRPDQRAEAMGRLKEATDLFSPFITLENDGRRVKREKAKILPLWHGTAGSVAHLIAKSGFEFFGKTKLGQGNSNDPTSTDDGFFGSGLYFTNSARYAADIYSKGHLLIAWVSMGGPFPVVGDPKQEDMKTLRGKGAYKHYDAHYVPVCSLNPSDLFEATYHPVQKGKEAHCDEIVVFQKAQTLPRFWIELCVEPHYQKTLPATPLDITNPLMRQLFKLLRNPHIDQDSPIRNHLGKMLGYLLKFKGDPFSLNYYKALQNCLTQLIDAQGKINNEMKDLIQRLPFSGPPFSEEAPFLNHLLEKGHLYLYGHLFEMKGLSTRNAREEKIKTFSFSKLSHIILETRKALIKEVTSKIPPQAKEILFLLGNTGSGKSTTLCFLRGDPMTLNRDGSYSSTNSQDHLIGHGATSCTFLPTVEIRSDLILVDFPGFSDTNGPLISLGIECALKHLIRKYQPRVLILDKIRDINDRDPAPAEFGKLLKRLLGDTTNCILGITKYSKSLFKIV